MSFQEAFLNKINGVSNTKRGDPIVISTGSLAFACETLVNARVKDGEDLEEAMDTVEGRILVAYRKGDFDGFADFSQIDIGHEMSMFRAQCTEAMGLKKDVK